MIEGAVKHFEDTIMNKLSADLEIYKSCRHANPIWLRDKIKGPDFKTKLAQAIKKLERFTTRVIEAGFEAGGLGL